eukprot:TRINITY_DN14097_c0_g1_i5.p1 TRINITY_DN14097_c0_g1~~TRINITY_DN14097_c0_g1_i5.p1  ORF type:complete len:907 (-),score=256.57 TRINITY_DN14097_c0_g1_i5:33-2753(-)
MCIRDRDKMKGFVERLMKIRPTESGCVGNKEAVKQEQHSDELLDSWEDDLEQEESVHTNEQHERSAWDEERVAAMLAEQRAASQILLDEYTQLQERPEYQRMLVTRHKLPMWGVRQELLDAVHRHAVVLVVGDTGCGKSTQVPQFLLDSMIESGLGAKAQVVCTQPRRIAAIGVAERTAAERAGSPGDVRSQVGYHIRLEAVAHPSATKLLFCTTGILLRRLQSEPELGSVTHVVIDEVHERDLNIDFLLLILKDLLSKRSDLKVVLMSATFNDKLLSAYFPGCAVVRVAGRMFPVEDLFLEDCIERTGHQVDTEAAWARHKTSTTHYVNARVGGKLNTLAWEEENSTSTLVDDETLVGFSESTKKALGCLDCEKTNLQLIEELVELEFNNGEPDGGILIFMSGLREIHTVYDRLAGHPVFGDEHRCLLVPLHSSVSPADQRAIFCKPPAGVQRIVIATNIAETSVTIDNVVCVIDSGRAKVNRYSASRRMSSLVECSISRASAAQRRGRAGRVRPGRCYRLYTQAFYRDKMNAHELPEMLRSSVTGLVLQIKTLNIEGGVEEVFSRLVQPPAVASVSSSVHELQELGAMDEDENLTTVGLRLARLPVDVRVGKMLLLGVLLSCVDPVLTIAAIMSHKQPFVAPMEKRDQADRVKKSWCKDYSDHLTWIRVYESWLHAARSGRSESQRFCDANFVSHTTMEQISDIRNQLQQLLHELRLTQPPAHWNDNSHCDRVVSGVLVAALYPGVARLEYGKTGGANSRKKLVLMTGHNGKEEAALHPCSVNHGVGHFEAGWMVFHEKVRSSRVFVHDTSLVTPFQLLLFGGREMVVEYSQRQLVVDKWMRFTMAPVAAALCKRLRIAVDELLNSMLEVPEWSSQQAAAESSRRQRSLLDLIVYLLKTEFTHD